MVGFFFCAKFLNIFLYSVKKSKMSFDNMFEEVPVVVKNSHLVNALCCEIEDRTAVEDKFQLLDLATGLVFTVQSKVSVNSLT